MNRLTDMEVNVAVRRVLVRHWIDLGKVSIRTTRGVVWLSGSLVRLRNGGAEMKDDEMVNVFDEIRTVRGVRRMHPRLINWNSEDQDLPEGEELEQTKGTGPSTPTKSGGSQAASTYTVKDNGSLSYRELVEALNNASKAQKEDADEPSSAQSQ